MTPAPARIATDATTVPIRDVGDFEAALEHARTARSESLGGVAAEHVIATLADAAHDWLVPDHPLRVRAVAAIAGASGWAPGMITTGIDFVFGAVTAESLRALVEDEAGGLAALSPPAPARKRAPGVVYQALAGNVPGQGIPAIVAALLAGSVLIVRDSSRQPALTTGFRETIATREPRLARMIVPVEWQHDGRARAFERAIVAAADRIELHGSDATIASLARRYAAAHPTAVALHGSRVSIGIVPAGADLVTTAEAFALDIAMYEGRGCLTPHALYIEGDSRRTRLFASHLANALERIEARWPRARGTIAEEAARRRFFDDAELAAIGSAVNERLAGDDGAWCIAIAPDEDLRPGPGGRCIRLVAVPSLTGFGLRAAVAVAAVGVPGGPSAVDAALADRLARTGASIVLPAGRMQAPPIGWRQDGVRRLGDLLGDPP